MAENCDSKGHAVFSIMNYLIIGGNSDIAKDVIHDLQRTGMPFMHLFEAKNKQNNSSHSAIPQPLVMQQKKQTSSNALMKQRKRVTSMVSCTVLVQSSFVHHMHSIRMRLKRLSPRILPLHFSPSPLVERQCYAKVKGGWCSPPVWLDRLVL